jgi:hypothetical protein
VRARLQAIVNRVVDFIPGWGKSSAVAAGLEMDVFRLHIVGMNNTLFLVLVWDLMLVACIWAAFLLDRLTERRRSKPSAG